MSGIAVEDLLVYLAQCRARDPYPALRRVVHASCGTSRARRPVGRNGIGPASAVRPAVRRAGGQKPSQRTLATIRRDDRRSALRRCGQGPPQDARPPVRSGRHSSTGCRATRTGHLATSPTPSRTELGLGRIRRSARPTRQLAKTVQINRDGSAVSEYPPGWRAISTPGLAITCRSRDR